MIGKKKQKDVQFFSEVVDSSTNLEGSKRYSYDPDELVSAQPDAARLLPGVAEGFDGVDVLRDRRLERLDEPPRDAGRLITCKDAELRWLFPVAIPARGQQIPRQRAWPEDGSWAG